MKRLMLLALGALLVSGPVFAQDKAKAADKTMSASGEVTAVTAKSLTVKGKAGEWTFDVDKSTHVSVAGATKKTTAAKESKEPLEITQYVKVGDTVNVKYHDMGATKHAADVSVRNSAPGAAKK
jgi:type 1 fimbria pilin